MKFTYRNIECLCVCVCVFKWKGSDLFSSSLPDIFDNQVKACCIRYEYIYMFHFCDLHVNFQVSLSKYNTSDTNTQGGA